MLPKSWRLVHQVEIKQAYFTKFRSTTKHTQIYLKATEINNFQVLVIISKKIFKKANLRNRLRRRIIAIFEKLKTESRLPTNISCIIQVKNKNLLYQTSENIKIEILNSVSDLFQKLKSKNVQNSKQK